MLAYPGYAKLHTTIAGLLPSAVAFHGILFRASTPVYANSRDLLTGDGSRKFGGRWNPPVSFPVVYLATSFEGALAETVGVAGHYGFDPATRLPITLVAIDVTLDHVLDLTHPAIRKSLDIILAEMNGCPWRSENAAGREALTQAIGRAAHDAGFQGIRVASSLKRTFQNLNVFPLNLGGAGRLKIRSAGKLPLPPLPGMP